jgi:signal transduction histidine kinase
MPQIALAQWAHDVRNALGTVALYVETLERPSDPHTIRIVALTNAMLAKAATMCSDAVRQSAHDDARARRRGFDLMRTIAEVVDLIAPVVPAPTSLHVAASGPAHVLADPEDVFRILFNLIHNAVGVARKSGAIRNIRLSVEKTDRTVVVRVADDGPGLPKAVRARLFRRGQSTTGGCGHGLAIARELAERNGAVLDLADAKRGTVFTIELQRAAPEPSFA